MILPIRARVNLVEMRRKIVGLKIGQIPGRETANGIKRGWEKGEF